MKKQLIALCFIALFGSSLGVSIAESSGIPSATSTLGVSAAPRGVLAQIAARIAADGPLDDIFGLFTTLEQTIRKEQVTHDALSSKQQAECKTELDFRNKEIADATSALQRASEEKGACSTSLTQARSELKTQVKFQEDTKTHLENLRQTRASEKAAFDKNEAASIAAINSVDEGHKMLQELYSGSATLIDISKATQKMFAAGLSINRAEHFGPVISALAQVAQKSELLIDANVLQRVEELFKLLRERLVAGQKKDQQVEADAIKRFEVAQEKDEKELKASKKVEGNLRASIANLEQCVIKAENIIALSTTKKERNSSLLKAAEIMCKNFEEEYKTATSARKEELALVDHLRSVCQKKLKFTQGVTERASQGTDEWKKYDNQAKIAGPASWTKQGGKFNAAGAAQAGYKVDDELARLI